MAYDDELASRVRRALARAQHIEERQMFGGLAFMVGGKICVSVGRDRLMCRIDPAIHDAALQHRGCRPVVMNGRHYRGYVHVDGDAVRSERELGRWIRLALAFNARANSARRRQQETGIVS